MLMDILKIQDREYISTFLLYMLSRNLCGRQRSKRPRQNSNVTSLFWSHYNGNLLCLSTRNLVVKNVYVNQILWGYLLYFLLLANQLGMESIDLSPKYWLKNTKLTWQLWWGIFYKIKLLSADTDVCIIQL